MKKELQRLERIVDVSIPWLVIVLAFVIVFDYFGYLDAYKTEVKVFDWLIVAFFLIDIAFKWHRTRKLGKFVRLYWLDIVAVFPFYLVFRAFIAASELLRLGEESQNVLHEAVLVRETKLLREERLLKEFELGRGIRAVQRFIRFIAGRIYVSHWRMTKVSAKHRKHYKPKRK